MDPFVFITVVTLVAGAGGTGLGLAIVKHIAAGIGAQLSLESQVGVGTAITVQFPPLQGQA